MSDPKPAPGTIGWIDLTVDDAAGLRDFYAAVVGWEATPLSMGGYDDYCVGPAEGGDPVAGVCHRRGGNAHLPPVWMMYIVVEDLDASLKACAAGGGALVGDVRKMGEARYAVIRDPAGAHCALYQA
ncbi:MAG TPA: VOC family protein [Candidatus Krumholzibacteria bacterium]|nr:VOC family protein [Candidatus Krumholzibacteria bacterium]